MKSADECPKCGADTKVIDTRHGPNNTPRRRTRACLKCRHRFATLEVLASELSAYVVLPASTA